MRIPAFHAAILLASAFLPICGLAGSATWKSNPVDSDWNDASNWKPATVPNGPNDRATFGISNITDVSLPAGVTELDSVGFDYHGDVFTITVGTADQGMLHITGIGIPNASGLGQTIVVRTPRAEGLALYNTAAVGIQTVFTVENASAIGFYQNTDAGFGLFTILGGDSSEPGGSQLNFYDNASASNGYFYTTTGGSAPSAEGGTISFYGNSAGNNSWITNKAAIDPGAASGGTTTFHDNSTAGANITNESGPVTGGLQNRGSTTFMDNSDANHVSVFCDGAQSATEESAAVEFFDSSTANIALLVANAGSQGGEGGLIRFWNSSTGDNATVQLHGNGTLDISNLDAQDFHIGSLDGDGGVVLLGNHSINIGSLDVSTQVDGIIEGSGPLTKVGIGTFTLTGANSYTDGTVITGGFLRADNKRGSATGTGAVQVNSGTLGGAGIIAGPVTVGSNSRRGASIAPGSGTSTLTLQSTLTFNAHGSYVWRIKTASARGDKVIANGVTIKSGAQFNPIAIGHVQLPAGTSFVAVSNTAATPIVGTFSNLVDGSTITIGNNIFQANYEGGDGNDVTLTVVP